MIILRNMLKSSNIASMRFSLLAVCNNRRRPTLIKMLQRSLLSSKPRSSMWLMTFERSPLAFFFFIFFIFYFFWPWFALLLFLLVVVVVVLLVWCLFILCVCLFLLEIIESCVAASFIVALCTFGTIVYHWQ